MQLHGTRRRQSTLFPPPPVEMDRWTDGWASLTPLLFLLLQQLTRRRRRRRKKSAGPAAGPLPPSLPPRSHLTYTYVWCTRLRLPLAPGNEITITAASTDVRECALAGLGPRRRAGGTENAEEEGEGDGFAKIWQEIRPTKKASVRS